MRTEPSVGRARSRAGATLVEVMLATLILAITAVAGAGFLSLSRTSVVVQRDLRVAAEAANARLELVKATSFSRTDLPEPNLVYYLAEAGGNLTINAMDPNEKADINGRMLPMVTTAEHVTQAGPPVLDYLRVRVSVNYRPATADAVKLETVFFP